MNMKNYGIIVLLILFTGLSSCSEENNLEEDSDKILEFTALSIQTLENLSSFYPAEDIVMEVKKNDNGFVEALFLLKGDTKKAIDFGQFASKNSNDGGTTCDGPFKCGKAAKKCLDDGKKALISNGACRDDDAFCVECVD